VSSILAGRSPSENGMTLGEIAFNLVLFQLYACLPIMAQNTPSYLKKFYPLNYGDARGGCNRCFTYEKEPKVTSLHLFGHKRGWHIAMRNQNNVATVLKFRNGRHNGNSTSTREVLTMVEQRLDRPRLHLPSTSSGGRIQRLLVSALQCQSDTKTRK
jgi:hypothetical protein